MALIVEDGSIVENANSYNTEAEIVNYCAIYGKTITTEQAEQYVLRNRVYFDTKSYQGTQVKFGVQALPWPREDVYIEDNLLPSDEIPQLLKLAEREAALLTANGIDLQATITNANYIKEESFAVFKKVYQDGALSTPMYPRLDSLLDPLLDGGNSIIHYNVTRSYG